MTYPGGAPGGYPGQGAQQPQPGYGHPVGGGQRLNIPQIGYLVTAGLGVLNLFLAFANVSGTGNSGSSFYERTAGWVPGLLLISGVTALFHVLPGDTKPGAWPAIFAGGATIPFLFSVFQISDGGLGTGGVLVLIFGILQLLAATGAYLMEAGVIKMPPPSQAQSPYGGQPPGYGPPPGQQYPQQQPGQYGSPGAQTQYQPQPGQFPPPPGQQQQYPGTPPGGYPQQG
jgi:hypothetical protein